MKLWGLEVVVRDDCPPDALYVVSPKDVGEDSDDTRIVVVHNIGRAEAVKQEHRRLLRDLGG